MRKRLAVTLILIATVFSQLTYVTTYADDDLFRDKEVQIINRTGITISFYLRLSKPGWVLYSLPPGGKRIYPNVEQICVISQNGQRCYVMEKNKRYTIEWNSDIGLYDVYKLKK